MLEIKHLDMIGRMEDEAISTKPKPFVFVLMPFDPRFEDIYKFGIKGAAEEVGAYAERVDEQIFTEGILERVFNQINKADVVVADMTGRNPNVFYEVGYAHALGKIVLLFTENAADIPFDLKHHQHIVYEGSIEKLKSHLITRISWAIIESKRDSTEGQEQFEVSLDDIAIPDTTSSIEAPLIRTPLPVDSPSFIDVVVRNTSLKVTDPISHIYLFVRENARFSICVGQFPGWSYPTDFKAHEFDSQDGLTRQLRLPFTIPRCRAELLKHSILEFNW